MDRPIACLIYDFDKTLSPLNMQEYSFMAQVGMQADAFWAECNRFSKENGMDSILSYMFIMLEKARMAGCPVTRDMLRRQGEGIDFFPGVEDWFPRVNAIGEKLGLSVEHYIISSGLREIIEGTRIFHEFKAIFASSFCYDEAGVAFWPATAVNYTGKTQYLFRINKGILDVTNDYDLNNYTPEERRRVPFPHMIYIADGLTDVPCMKMARSKGGHSISVYAPGGDSRVADALLLQDRADYTMEADWREGHELEQTVTALFYQIAARNRCVRLHNEHLDAADSRRQFHKPYEGHS